jgi:hypothetical protein
MPYHTKRLPPMSRGALLLLVLLVIGFVPTAQAQTDRRYFPETGHFLAGAFRAFWETNGGVAIFGFPITEEYVSPSTGRVTQYFERARFELTERGGQPYVELGRLGVQITEGRIFPKVPPIPNTADRRYIPETQHIIQYGFKEVWETRGGERIFGYPISEEIDEVLENGEWHTVQYFERARFEYWPERPDGDRVLLTNLGRMLAPPELTAPLPPDAPPGNPAPAPEPAPAPAPEPAPAPAPEEPAPQDLWVPPSINANVVPTIGPPGTVFRLEAGGFAAGENVGVWVTAPDQSIIDADFQVQADDAGSITPESVTLSTDENFPDGVWFFVAQGVDSENTAVGYFRIHRGDTGIAPPAPAPAPAPQPPAPATSGRLGMPIHDQIPDAQGDAFVIPLAGPSGSVFEMTARGYIADEDIASWITQPDNTSIPLDSSLITRNGDGSIQVRVSSENLPDGLYTVVAEGQTSGTLSAASFQVTSQFVAGPGTPRPPSVNGSATPPEGTAGTVFQIRGQNLQPNEPLELWLTEPGGTYALLPSNTNADSAGRVGYSPAMDLRATGDFTPGIYGIHFRGRSSGARVSVYFTYVGP